MDDQKSPIKKRRFVGRKCPECGSQLETTGAMKIVFCSNDDCHFFGDY